MKITKIIQIYNFYSFLCIFWWLASRHRYPSCKSTPHSTPKSNQVHPSDVCCLQSAWSLSKRRCLPICPNFHYWRLDSTVSSPDAQPWTTSSWQKKWLDEGSAVDLIYLDFSKAFDSVNFRLLLDKLRGCGIVPIVISSVACFLSQRTFQVNVNGILS